MGTSLEAKLFRLEDRKISKNPLESELEAKEVDEDITSSTFILQKIESKPQSSSPKPPFRTSTLQMSAASRLGFTADRTM